MRTFLIGLGLVYGVAALTLMAIGAFFQISRWWATTRARRAGSASHLPGYLDAPGSVPVPNATGAPRSPATL